MKWNVKKKNNKKKKKKQNKKTTTIFWNRKENSLKCRLLIFSSRLLSVKLNIYQFDKQIYLIRPSMKYEFNKSCRRIA